MRTLNKYIVFSVSFLMLWATPHSAMSEVNYSRAEALTILDRTLIFEFNSITNFDDNFFTIQPGLFSEKINLSYSLLFGMRPKGRITRVKRSDHFYYQFKEDRYVLGAALEKRMQIKDRIWAGFNTGFSSSFGSYQGASLPVHAQWQIQPLLGTSLIYRWENTLIRVGYQYLNIPDSGNHNLLLGVTFNTLRPPKKQGTIDE